MAFPKEKAKKFIDLAKHLDAAQVVEALKTDFMNMGFSTVYREYDGNVHSVIYILKDGVHSGIKYHSDSQWEGSTTKRSEFLSEDFNEFGEFDEFVKDFVEKLKAFIKVGCNSEEDKDLVSSSVPCHVFSTSYCYADLY